MSKKSIAVCSGSTSSISITNRSPWMVFVPSDKALNKKFRFGLAAEAQTYQQQLQAQGRLAKLEQLETSFQLRVRRHGIKAHSMTFDTRAQAEQAALKIKSEFSVSIVRDYAVAAQTTLRTLMERYRDGVAPQHKGAAIEIGRLNRIMRQEVFVDKKLAALRTEDLQSFVGRRLVKVKPATVDRDLDQLSQVINYADGVWKIAAAENPFKGLRRPKYFNERSRRLSKADEKALLHAARQDENPYIEPAIILALETAMRRGELLALTAKDIDFERRQIHARNTKNGRDRAVPMTARARAVLEALVEEGNAKLLNLSENALKLAFFRRVLPGTKLEDLHFHDLRHEAISRLAESGHFQLIELQAISGHRDMRLLMRYAHLCAGNLAAKMDSVSDGQHEVYIHRGRKRFRGRMACNAPTQGSEGQAGGLVSQAAVVEAQAVQQTAPQRFAQVIPFPRINVA